MNYFKVWCPRSKANQLVFFDDADASDVALSFAQVHSRANRIAGAKVSVWAMPRASGPWSNLPVISR